MHSEAYAGRSLGRSVVLEVYNKQSEHHYLGSISRRLRERRKTYRASVSLIGTRSVINGTYLTLKARAVKPSVPS